MQLSREYTILIVAQQFNSSPLGLIVEVSRSHIIWHTVDRTPLKERSAYHRGRYLHTQ